MILFLWISIIVIWSFALLNIYFIVLPNIKNYLKSRENRRQTKKYKNLDINYLKQIIIDRTLKDLENEISPVKRIGGRKGCNIVNSLSEPEEFEREIQDRMKQVNSREKSYKEGMLKKAEASKYEIEYITLSVLIALYEVLKVGWTITEKRQFLILDPLAISMFYFLTKDKKERTNAKN